MYQVTLRGQVVETVTPKKKKVKRKRLPESPCIALADTLERRKRRGVVSAERFLLSRRKHLHVRLPLNGCEWVCNWALSKRLPCMSCLMITSVWEQERHLVYTPRRADGHRVCGWP